MDDRDLALRQCSLAVSVLHEIDLVPADDGVLLPAREPVLVPWPLVRRALAGVDPATPTARLRLARWLRVALGVAEAAPPTLVAAVRPVGMPVDSALHPGPDWVRERVLGGALDLGLGLVGLDPGTPEAVVPAPQEVLDAAGVDAGTWWPGCRPYLDDMGELAAARWHRDPAAPLRNMGDCDVVTLLGSAPLRRALVADSGGMRGAAVPMRDRGWLDLRRIDPAFAPAAAAATSEERRGFPRPLLITKDEVVMVRAGGRAVALALADPASDPPPWLRPVRYR